MPQEGLSFLCMVLSWRLGCHPFLPLALPGPAAVCSVITPELPGHGLDSAASGDMFWGVLAALEPAAAMDGQFVFPGAHRTR